MSSMPLPPVVSDNLIESDLGPDKGDVAVLLVDDNQINLRILTTFMKRKGYPHVTALNGLEAVQAYERALQTRCVNAPNEYDGPLGLILASRSPAPPFDFVLMDMNMPVMDGFEATRRIRAIEQRARLKPARIVALTGLASAQAQQLASRSGVNLFLTKPVRLKELAEIIGERAGASFIRRLTE